MFVAVQNLSADSTAIGSHCMHQVIHTYIDICNSQDGVKSVDLKQR